MSEQLHHELSALLNRHGKESGSNTPDFILAEYLEDCLIAFDKATVKRTWWYQPAVSPDKEAAKRGA